MAIVKNVFLPENNHSQSNRCARHGFRVRSMKKALLLGIFIMMCASLLAQESTSAYNTGGATQRETHVTPAQALNVGYAFMRTGSRTHNSNVSKQTMQLVYTGQATDSLTGIATDCYYVFALQPKGFVIVAADDRVEPILGYSYDNNFVVADMPDHVRGWLGNYERQIQAVAKSDLQAEPATQTKWARLKSGLAMSTRSFGDTVVGPLLTTTWDQGQYYNSLCPTDASGPAGHALTGCVATAMAQIINYWGYPAHGRGTHSYESNYGNLTVNYDSTLYEYTNMPNALTSTSTTDEVNAVATLMRDCGVAVNMGYSPSESGAFILEARAALVNFFNYSSNMNYAEKSNIAEEEWKAMLRNDLDAGIPVLYTIQGTSGHALICDGYNSDDFFSFNFGWGGYADGWYHISSINTGGAYFNNSHTAIFGIIPDSTSNVILGQMAGSSTFSVNKPFEFYHLLGHNTYQGNDYDNPSNNTVTFISANNEKKMGAVIMEFEDQDLTLYDGNGTLLRGLQGGIDNDLSPVLSSTNALRIEYSGPLYYAGFKLSISQIDSCRMVSNIVTHIDTTTVHLTWRENGTAAQWEIEYGIKGFELGTGTTYTTDTNTATFSNLLAFTEYDFYIRPVCDSTHNEPWNMVTILVEAAYWQDIVTSQPTGYVYNAQTNTIEVSTAEGLAWWAKNSHCAQPKVCLTADIDLSGYKWRPVEICDFDFDGQGHQISNAYIREESIYVGFFSMNWNGTIENLGLSNSYIKGPLKIGGLCGGHQGVLKNCYVTKSSIVGTNTVGGLIGECSYGIVSNCFVNVNVVGDISTNLMIGSFYNGSVQNSYAAGNLKVRSFWCPFCSRGGIVTDALGGEISNCYGVVTHDGIANGNSTIYDTSTIVMSDNGWQLLTPVVFDEVLENDLISALNRGVESYNDSSYCTWIADTGMANGGYPIFGNKHVVHCPNVSDVSVQNIKVDTNNAVTISWTENSNATQWCIRYRRHDMLDTAFTYITVTSNPDTIYGIPLGHTYDFNVRAFCDTNNRSGWSTTQTAIIDLIFWTDVVKSQPDGYIEDSDGNVEISSAEGLAWLSVLSNGLHNNVRKSFSGKTVTLTSDINIGGYLWHPIGYDHYWNGIGFSGTFDGQNHTISNIYTNGESGLIGFLYYGSVKNVNLEGGAIRGGNGGLIGTAQDFYEISNCHTSTIVYGQENVGSLCGAIYVNGDGPAKTIISNCSSSGAVYGRESCGNLIGYVYAAEGYVEIRNCYATGDVRISDSGGDAWYRGGLIGYIRGAHVNNCFSTGNVETTNQGKWLGKSIGALDINPHVHYLYVQDNVNVGWDILGHLSENELLNEDISDTSLFHHNGNANNLLNTVSIGATNYSDLLDALNAWVILQNDPTLKLWTSNPSTGYPVFGDYYVPSCINPSELTVSQATGAGDATIKTRLAWTQEGTPDHWEVLYVVHGQNKDSGTIIPVDSNSCVLAGIPTGQALDFYVRAICGEGDTSYWCFPVTYIPEKLHWTDIITSQPEGFRQDANGNIFISSAEGLSWLSSITNELNGTQFDDFYGKKIFLTRDIDLSAYRWTAISGIDWVHGLSASFNGNNHIVSGLYCNELSLYQGLFGVMNGDISNIVLKNVVVYGSEKTSPNGTSTVGGLVGYSRENNICNCMVTGNVGGYGIAGTYIHGSQYIENSCFIGSAFNNGNPIELCQSLFGETVNCYVSNTNAQANTERYYIGSESNSAFTGSGHTWTLSSPPYINGAFRTDLVEALNAWVDVNNTDGRHLHWVADTGMVNEGYPVFESVSYPAVAAHDTVLAAGYFSWHGMVFFSDTVLTDTLPTLNGYDSVVTYHIFVNPIPLTEVSVDTCSNYIWNGETYSETGDYVQSFPSAVGDSIVVLHLTINRMNGVDVHHVCDNSYTWIDGVTYVTNNNTATYTLQTADGCDSVVTLNLTIGHRNSGDTPLWHVTASTGTS